MCFLHFVGLLDPVLAFEARLVVLGQDEAVVPCAEAKLIGVGLALKSLEDRLMNFLHGLCISLRVKQRRQYSQSLEFMQILEVQQLVQFDRHVK